MNPFPCLSLNGMFCQTVRQFELYKDNKTVYCVWSKNINLVLTAKKGGAGCAPGENNIYIFLIYIYREYINLFFSHLWDIPGAVAEHYTMKAKNTNLS